MNRPRPLIIILLIGLIASALVWYANREYSQTDINQAWLVVRDYYGSIGNGDYEQALSLLAPPPGLVRDWPREWEAKAKELKLLADTNRYVMGEFSQENPSPETPPRRSKPLTFLVTFTTHVNGKQQFLNELVRVQRVDGQLRIVEFVSVDYFVGYRAFNYQLSRVVNWPW